MIASSLRAGTSLGRDESKRHSSILIKIEIKIWSTPFLSEIEENRWDLDIPWYEAENWGKLRRSWNFEFSFKYKFTSFVPVTKFLWKIFSNWKVIRVGKGLIYSKTISDQGKLLTGRIFDFYRVCRSSWPSAHRGHLDKWPRALWRHNTRCLRRRPSSSSELSASPHWPP